MNTQQVAERQTSEIDATLSNMQAATEESTQNLERVGAYQPQVSPLKVEDHMLSIASMLFDALSELPQNGCDTLDTIDT